MSAGKARQPLNTRLAELVRAVADARAQERDVEREHEAAKATVARITEALVEAFATGDESAAERLAGERADAERAVTAERLEGARRATQSAEAEAATFAAENLEALLGERVPAAQAAVLAVSDALEALQSAHAEWTSIEAESMRLTRLAGQDTTTQPPGTLCCACAGCSPRRLCLRAVARFRSLLQSATRAPRKPAASQSRITESSGA